MKKRLKKIEMLFLIQGNLPTPYKNRNDEHERTLQGFAKRSQVGDS